MHCITRKGFGYPPALRDPVDCLHGVGAFDVATGPATGRPQLGRRGRRAAGGASAPRPGSSRGHCGNDTLGQPGRDGRRIPDRVFDVGIAEQHAVTHAAGLAMGGLKPVVCLYATFLNRAFDQLLMDVALHRQPVTFVLNRPESPAGRAVAPWHVGPVLPAAGSGLALAAPATPAARPRCYTHA
ncbi:transketolase, pyrimidine binding domain protein [Mycobacterium xenopi 4042]|uniref:Transketolase, pyrimidine binding domain protein n=1 Tax=Mycobacterium xenopi 4042 TaxID=1299334 RepID=X8EWT4_MYCXE|nr:transketolase, pyrimidine binding domain protein [Mycobacterium xenopi 4042]